ncbi:alpha/beta hydrolase family protein [Pedobacter namyangjuensis]|uniref:alpha/beta hydrolase family protein n=1 Tax=Pedobacter namyangjuensis TaxID=600626 RepID=UPI000DE47CFF|nr:acetylxylan esterase [Pedobacter namyangjuensis]
MNWFRFSDFKLFVVFCLFQFSCYLAFAQKQFNVLDWKADVSVNTYLLQQMQSQYNQREIKFVSALASNSSTETYIKNIRTKFKDLVGKLPQRADLAAETTGTIRKDSYRIEKIVYQSFENHHVTANLYIPNGKGKFPAVLLFCGHEDLAKATESYQKTAILLAKHGFVVFVIDPISQSERVQLTDDSGKALTRGSTTEHTLLNLSSNLLGTSAAAYELFDNTRGLDYLLSRPEVDATKIGCTGNSGGAMQAIYFAAFDDRVKVVAPCSYLASRAYTFATTGAADGCAQIPTEGLAQLEMSDYLIAAAPKPILVLAGRYDFIAYNATLDSYADLQKVYKSLGAEEKLSIFTVDDGHGISKPKRERVVQWFRKWFYNDEKKIEEQIGEVETDVDLFATKTGKVSTSYKNEINIAQQNIKLFNDKKSDRLSFAKKSKAEKVKTINRLLTLNPDIRDVDAETVGEVIAKNISFKKIVIRKVDEVPMPILVYYPALKPTKVLIWLSDKGKNHLADSASLVKAHLQQGYALIIADLPGMGETADKISENDPKYFDVSYRNAILGLHVGKPLVGLQTSAVLNLIKFVTQEKSLTNLPIEINAEGTAGISALHATFLKDNVAKLNLFGVLKSYKETIDTPLTKNRYVTVIPNVLSYYDLPDIINWIGDKRVSVR